MAKKSIVRNNKKREKMIKLYKNKRDEIKKLIKKSRLSLEHKNTCFKNVLKLDSLSRNGSSVRYRNRCLLTGRSRGLVSYNRFGLCNFKLREQANLGNIPGLFKV